MTPGPTPGRACVRTAAETRPGPRFHGPASWRAPGFEQRVAQSVPYLLDLLIRDLMPWADKISSLKSMATW